MLRSEGLYKELVLLYYYRTTTVLLPYYCDTVLLRPTPLNSQSPRGQQSIKGGGGINRKSTLATASFPVFLTIGLRI